MYVYMCLYITNLHSVKETQSFKKKERERAADVSARVAAARTLSM